MILTIMHTVEENLMRKYHMWSYYLEEMKKYTCVIRNVNISAGKADMRKFPAAFFLYLDVFFPIRIH